MIVHQAFRLEPLPDGPEPAGGLSPAEERYAARAGHPRGSRAARRLAKQLLVEWLGRDVDPASLEILPQGATAAAAVPSGPPPSRPSPASGGRGLAGQDPAVTGVAPKGRDGDGNVPSGPPELRVPEGLLPDDLRVHVSLSHCRAAVAVLLVVERVG